MLDEITRAVLAREEVAQYLRGEHGESRSRRASGSTPTSTSCGRRSVIASTARCSIRSIRSCARSSASPSTSTHVTAAGAAHGRCTRRTTRATPTTSSSRSCSTTTASGRRCIAAGINLFGGAARAAAPARHRRHPDPPQHEGPGLPDHAQGLRRRDPEAARPVLLPGGRPELQRRAEAAEDRADAGGAARRAGRPAIVPMAIAYDLVLEDHILVAAAGEAAAAAVRAGAGGDGRGYAVGYRSRAFVTFGAADSRLASTIRIPGATSMRAEPADADAHRAARTRCCRRRSFAARDAAVDDAARSRVADRPAARGRWPRADANLGVASGAAGGRRGAPSCSSVRGVVVAERRPLPRARRSVLRYYARTIEHLLVTAGRTH